MPDFGDAETAGRRTRAADVLLLVVLGALMAFASIPTDTYLPAFPAIASEFGVDEGRIQLTISSYLIGFSLGQLVWGPISDRVGRRGPVVWGRPAVRRRPSPCVCDQGMMGICCRLPEIFSICSLVVRWFGCYCG